MSIGKSGRIVIVIDPGLKRRLYASLAEDQCSLKDWFIERAQDFIANKEQPKLFKDKSTD